jgi:hypothetical protein
MNTLIVYIFLARSTIEYFCELESEDNNSNNNSSNDNNNNNSIIYVPSQQPQGQITDTAQCRYNNTIQYNNKIIMG